MLALAAARRVPRAQPLSRDLVSELFGGLAATPRRDQAEILEFVRANLDRVDPRSLQAHYNYLLHQLRRSIFGQTRGPTRQLADLVVEATSGSLVTQSRVDFLAKMYAQDPSPHISRVLAQMRAVAAESIYIPVTGQKTAEEAKLPRPAVLKLSSQDVGELAEVYTDIYRTLAATRHRDLKSAENLAALHPAVAASGNLTLPIEQFVYEYLRDEWPGKVTLTLLEILKLLRFWPTVTKEVLETRLLGPLAVKSNSQAALAIANELYHFSDEGHQFLDTIRTKVADSGATAQIVLFQHYILSQKSPPADFTESLIISAPGGIFLAELWAREAPGAQATLQGTFALPQRSEIEQILPNVDLDAVFSFANVPWVGSESQALLATLAPGQAVASPNIITDETLEPLGLSYPEFCMKLLDNLDAKGLYLEGYLQAPDQDDAGEVEQKDITST